MQCNAKKCSFHILRQLNQTYLTSFTIFTCWSVPILKQESPSPRLISSKKSIIPQRLLTHDSTEATEEIPLRTSQTAQRSKKMPMNQTAPTDQKIETTQKLIFDPWYNLTLAPVIVRLSVIFATIPCLAYFLKFSIEMTTLSRSQTNLVLPLITYQQIFPALFHPY